jgi:hypothetical protein
MTLGFELQWTLFLGSLAAEWSDIERFLDLWIEAVHSIGGAQQIQIALPPNLDRELDYLSTALKLGLLNGWGCRRVKTAHPRGP